MAFPAAVCGIGDVFGTLTSPAIVQTDAGVRYMFKIEATVLYYRKSSDNGVTYGQRVTISAAVVDRAAVWYDRWTPGDSGDFIHIGYENSTSDRFLYRPLDTSSDTLGTEVIVFSGVSGTTNALLSVTKTRGGKVHVFGSIDGGTEFGHGAIVSPYTSSTSRATTGFSEADFDAFIAVPGNYADNNDFDVIYQDASANTITIKTYDDSANTWSESSSVDTDITESFSASSFMSATVKRSTNLVFFAAWSAFDVSTADLRCWSFDGTTVSALTNIVTNSDDCYCVSLVWDAGAARLYAFYLGKSDGSETATTSWKVYYKYSDDSGSTWSAEQTLYDVLHSGFSLSAPASISSLQSSCPPVVFDIDNGLLVLNSVPSAVVDSNRAARLVNGGVVRAA